MFIKKWWNLLMGNSPKPVTPKIKLGHSLQVKTKGSQSIEYVGGNEVHVYADDPEITAPPHMKVVVHPAKK